LGCDEAICRRFPLFCLSDGETQATEGDPFLRRPLRHELRTEIEETEMRPDFMKEIRILLASLPLIALTACGSPTPPVTTTTYTVGGNVSGLAGSASVVLLDNGGDALTVSSNGAFTFKTALPSAAAYAVTVGTQPSGETCTVTSGSGTVATANVTGVVVSCAANTYTVGGNVSGLAASASVVLLDNGGDALTVSSNGAFTFKTALASAAAYAVTVATQPSGETCTVSSGSGTVGTANITSVVVTCATTVATTYSITVDITNLVGTIGVTLNGSDTASVTNPSSTPASETMIFPDIATGTKYTVTVTTQPTGYTCATSDGSGTIASANVTVNIACTAIPNYSINVDITDLVGTIGVTLNGSDTASVTNPSSTPASETMIFPDIATGTKYTVTVTTQPTGYTCATSDGTGTVGSANVTVTINCTAIPTYNITVQITNLLGTIGIALNGGTPQSVTVGGGTPETESLTFLNIASGTKYTVTVTTQPTGYACATSDGSGTVGSANVTVNIACTESGGGSSGFWIPYSATPVSDTSGQGGLFVIASNSIAASPAPAPAFVTTSVPTLLGAAYQGFVSGTTPPSSVTPAVIMYAAAGADGNTHVYGLDLTDTSTTPVPVQITNLSVPPSEHICSEGQVESDLATPSSLSVVMYVTAGTAGAKPGTVGYCGSSPGTYELAHYADEPTVAPVTLNIPGGTALLSALENDLGFTALYQTSGELGGIVLWDASTGDLDFYSDATFTSSTTLLSNVGFGGPCVNVGAISNGNLSGGSRLLLNVTTASGTTAYQITASGGAPQQFFAGSAGSCVTDSSNLFFIGTPTGSSTPAIYQEPLAATPPAQALFTLPATSETAGSNLIGSNGSELLFQNYSESSSGITSSIFGIPEGKSSTSATAIGGSISGSLETALLASPTGNAANDLLFLTATDETSSGVSYSSQALTTGGTLGAKLPNTVLASFGPLSPQLDGNLLAISGITDTNGGYGGGTVNAFSVESLAPTPLTASGGSAYTVPPGYVISLDGFYGTGIGTGFLISVANPNAPYIGAVVDLSQDVILPISLTNSSISPLF
jgi:hypothetical protein